MELEHWHIAAIKSTISVSRDSMERPLIANGEIMSVESVRVELPKMRSLRAEIAVPKYEFPSTTLCVEAEGNSKLMVMQAAEM